MQAIEPTPAIYLKAEALDRALDDTLGRRARQGHRAEFLKVDRSSWWRFRKHIAPVNHDFIARVLRALPQASFHDLFEVQDKKAAHLQDVAA